MKGFRDRWKSDGACLIFVTAGWLTSFVLLLYALSFRFGVSIVTVAVPAVLGWLAMTLLFVFWGDLREWVLPTPGKLSFLAAGLCSLLLTLSCVGARLMIAGLNPIEYSLSEDLISLSFLWLTWPFCLVVAVAGTLGALLGQIVERGLGSYLDR